eukprot:Hpha_TRINITY_DN7780_c0_g2::TRINITY_DN7780_c0_g2_i1::g.85362::m.85362
MAVVLTRLGLPGGREASTTIPGSEPGARRVREWVAAALKGATGVERVPLPPGARRIRAVVPDEGSEDGGRRMRVTVGSGLGKLEVLPDLAGEGMAASEPSCYNVGLQEADRLYRMLFTEFALKDPLGGHTSSAFSVHANDDPTEEEEGSGEVDSKRAAILASVQRRIAEAEAYAQRREGGNELLRIGESATPVDPPSTEGGAEEAVELAIGGPGASSRKTLVERRREAAMAAPAQDRLAALLSQVEGGDDDDFDEDLELEEDPDFDLDEDGGEVPEAP